MFTAARTWIQILAPMHSLSRHSNENLWCLVIFLNFQDRNNDSCQHYKRKGMWGISNCAWRKMGADQLSLKLRGGRCCWWVAGARVGTRRGCGLGKQPHRKLNYLREQNWAKEFCFKSNLKHNFLFLKTEGHCGLWHEFTQQFNLFWAKTDHCLQGKHALNCQVHPGTSHRAYECKCIFYIQQFRLFYLQLTSSWQHIFLRL